MIQQDEKELDSKLMHTAEYLATFWDPKRVEAVINSRKGIKTEPTTNNSQIVEQDGFSVGDDNNFASVLSSNFGNERPKFWNEK